MSKNIPIFLAVLVCAAILYPAAAQSTSNIGGVFDYDKAKNVVKNINNIRQSQGFQPLKMDASLTEAAMLRAAELAYQRAGNGYRSRHHTSKRSPYESPSPVRAKKVRC